MPFIRVTTSEKIDDHAEHLMLMELGVSIECIEGKSEEWLMLDFRGGAKMAFSGEPGKCAMVEVDLLGKASDDDKDRLTENICNILNFVLEVPTNRIYVRYLETDSWGHDCHNF